MSPSTTPKVAFRTNLLTLTPPLKPCCDPLDVNPAVVLPVADLIEKPRPPPQPPPPTRAQQSPAGNNKIILNNSNTLDNNDTTSDVSSIDTDTSNMEQLHTWLVNSTNAGTTFKSGYDRSTVQTTVHNAERSQKQEAVTCQMSLSIDDNSSNSSVNDSNSDCSELEHMMEDLMLQDSTPATHRWCQSVKARRQDGLSFMGDNITCDDEEDICFPPGCSFDLTRPLSPTDIRDFPDTNFTPMPRPKYMLNSVFDQDNNDDTLIDNTVEPDDLDELDNLDDTLDNLTRNLVVNVKCFVRTLDIGYNTSTRVYRLYRKEDGSLIDTGANICMTKSRKGLVNVKTIDPITVGVAVESEQQSVTTCNQMGYLPMLREDGKYHYQPFLINPDASDMIMSLASIVESGKDFFSWEQVGFKDGRPGHARIMDNNGKVLLSLKCEKRQGLYYHTYQRLDRDNEPDLTSGIPEESLN